MGSGEAFKRFKEIYNKAPKELQQLIMATKNAPQRSDLHPEGNTLKHTMVVTMRAINQHPDDMDLIMAALFHDLGKPETLSINPSTGHPTAHGHENESAKYVDKFSDFIFDMGAHPLVVKDIVASHMAVKSLDTMKTPKQTEFYGKKNFRKIQDFAKLDKGGWYYPALKEIVENVIKGILVR